MDMEPTIPTDESVASTGRRRFLKTSAQVAITAPAATLLLSAHTKKAIAQVYGGEQPPPRDGLDNGLDDGTPI